MRRNSFQSMLRAIAWLVPETAVVTVSTAWTPAEAAAGGTPNAMRKLEEIMPKAMPSAPSTSWAKKPTATKVRKSGPRSMAGPCWQAAAPAAR